MNLENFNLGKFIFSNETKKFISEFINELAKTLNKTNYMKSIENWKNIKFFKTINSTLKNAWQRSISKNAF